MLVANLLDLERESKLKNGLVRHNGCHSWGGTAVALPGADLASTKAASD